LREDPTLRQELQEALQDVFPSRAEVAELRALREDFHRFAEEVVRRFEAVDRRFEAMDQRFVDLRQEMDRRNEKDVYLRGDGQVTYQELINVVDRLKEGGVERVALITDPPRRRRR
jgi:uncharacterized coiled-coil DUF342 family protein